MKKEKTKLRSHGIRADKNWKKVMDMAERYGFIVHAYGGTAMLATHKTQVESFGEHGYLRIQQVNGHCPKENGYEGCLSEDGTLKDCGSCWAKNGGLYVEHKRVRR